MTECKYPTCTNDVGQVDTDDYTYKHRSFCGPKHEVKYDHIKADARDAERTERQEAEEPEAYF